MNDSRLMDIHGGVSDIFTITPRLVNEFRAMVYRNHNSFNGVYSDRPDQLGNWQLSGNRSNIEKAAEWFDTSAFAENAPGTFGNSRRDTIVGPNYKSVDLGIVKKLSLGEVRRLEFETHATNVFNRANFEGYVTPSMNAVNYGQLTTAYAARNISFILKLYY